MHSRPGFAREVVTIIEKTEVPHEDVEDHRPLVGAEKAEVKRYEQSREKREIVDTYRTRIDKKK